MLDCPRCNHLVCFDDDAETVCCPECRCVFRIEYDADCVGDPPEFVPCNSLVPLPRYRIEPTDPERCRGCGMLVSHQVLFGLAAPQTVTVLCAECARAIADALAEVTT